MLRYAVLCFALYLSSACALLTEDEKSQLRENLKPIVKQCSDEMGVSEDDIAKWKESHEDADPCFISCIMKAEGVLNEKGMFDNDAAMVHLSKVVRNDATLQKFKDIGESCMSVNKEEVKDGDKSCDRVKMLAKCFMDHKADPGFA